MAKNYRREKIVKAIKRIQIKRESHVVRSPSDDERVKSMYKLFGVLTDDLLVDIIRELCREFDIKEEEIT